MSVLTHPPDLRIPLPLDEIADLCAKYCVSELSIFGSALREDFRPDSDLDFLVRFEQDDTAPWLGKFTDLEHDLSVLLGRRVELVDQNAVAESENYIRRRHILNSARQIYVA